MLKYSKYFTVRTLFILILNVPLFSLICSQTNSLLKQKYDKQEVYITMRDGVKLFTSIYTPKNTSVQHPILLKRTPYDIEPQGPENFNFSMQLYSRYTEGGNTLWSFRMCGANT
jgi:predicted acyl esterase